jgi:hypothetical protein
MKKDNNIPGPALEWERELAKRPWEESGFTIVLKEQVRSRMAGKTAEHEGRLGQMLGPIMKGRRGLPRGMAVCGLLLILVLGAAGAGWLNGYGRSGIASPSQGTDSAAARGTEAFPSWRIIAGRSSQPYLPGLSSQFPAKGVTVLDTLSASFAPVKPKELPLLQVQEGMIESVLEMDSTGTTAPSVIPVYTLGESGEYELSTADANGTSIHYYTLPAKSTHSSGHPGGDLNIFAYLKQGSGVKVDLGLVGTYGEDDGMLRAEGYEIKDSPVTLYEIRGQTGNFDIETKLVGYDASQGKFLLYVQDGYMEDENAPVENGLKLYKALTLGDKPQQLRLYRWNKEKSCMESMDVAKTVGADVAFDYHGSERYVFLADSKKGTEVYQYKEGKLLKLSGVPQAAVIPD